MKLSEFDSLDVNDTVYCLKRYPNMPHGWADSMDKLVGKPLTIIRINGDSIAVSPNNGLNIYTFDYKYLHLSNPAITKKPIHFEKSIFIQKKPLIKSQLKKLMLEVDYNIYKQICGDELVTTSMLYSAKKRVPRLIGVLLAHRYIEKVELTHDGKV